ncbi:hypothetical protein HN51_066103, partial [Arachis hypogaea]
RVAMAVSPSGINQAVISKLSPVIGKSTSVVLCSSFIVKFSFLLRSDSLIGESVLKHLWHHQDAIL